MKQLKATLTLEDETGKKVAITLDKLTVDLKNEIAKHSIGHTVHNAPTGWMDIRLRGFAAGTGDDRFRTIELSAHPETLTF